MEGVQFEGLGLTREIAVKNLEKSCGRLLFDGLFDSERLVIKPQYYSNGQVGFRAYFQI